MLFEYMFSMLVLGRLGMPSDPVPNPREALHVEGFSQAPRGTASAGLWSIYHIGVVIDVALILQ